MIEADHSNIVESESKLERDSEQAQHLLEEICAVYPDSKTDTERSLVLISAVAYRNKDNSFQEFLTPSLMAMVRDSDPRKRCLDIVVGLDNYDPKPLIEKLQNLPQTENIEVVILATGELMPPATSGKHRVVFYDPYNTLQSSEGVSAKGKVKMLLEFCHLLINSAPTGYQLPASTVMADHESYFVNTTQVGRVQALEPSQITQLIAEHATSGLHFLGARTINVAYATTDQEGLNHHQQPDFQQPISLRHSLDNLTHGFGTKKGLKGPGYVARTRELLAIMQTVATNHPSMKGEDTMFELVAKELGMKIDVSLIGATNLTPEVFAVDPDGTPSWLRQMVRWVEGTNGIRESYHDAWSNEDKHAEIIDKLLKFPAIGIAIYYLITMTLNTSPAHERFGRLHLALKHILEYPKSSRVMAAAQPHPTDDATKSGVWSAPVVK